MDQCIEDLESFNVARILMDTCCFYNIQGSVYLSIEGVGYDIFVKEMNYVEKSCTCCAKMVELELKVKRFEDKLLAWFKNDDSGNSPMNEEKVISLALVGPMLINESNEPNEERGNHDNGGIVWNKKLVMK